MTKEQKKLLGIAATALGGLGILLSLLLGIFGITMGEYRWLGLILDVFAPSAAFLLIGIMQFYELHKKEKNIKKLEKEGVYIPGLVRGYVGSWHKQRGEYLARLEVQGEDGHLYYSETGTAQQLKSKYPVGSGIWICVLPGNKSIYKVEWNT